MAGDDVVVLNEGLEFRTAKSGRTRATIKVTSEPLIHNFEPKELGREPAKAIADFYRSKIQGISALASAATVKARQVAARALAKGKPWAAARYAGGRTGEMPPNQSNRLFNDSGRLASSLVAGPGGDDAWRINVAGNRLDPNTADRGGVAAVAQIFDRLVSLVPELGDPSMLVSDITIARVIRAQQRRIVNKAAATSAKLGVEAVKTAIEAAVRVYETLNEIAG